MNDALHQLFSPPEENAHSIPKHFRILKRGGQPLLALPLASREASFALRLYAPQRPAARAVTAILRTLSRLRFPLPLTTKRCLISTKDPLCDFLTRMCPTWHATDSGIGILFGNPRANGRRFVLMLFENGAPVAVVKAGVDSAAQSLISAETRFLQSAEHLGIAAPLAVLESERVHAFAMRPLSGEAPRSSSYCDIQRVLQPWLTPTATTQLSDIPAWNKVSATCADSPIWQSHCANVSTRTVASAAMHGDFAPWNIKVHPESRVWQVFDWERGDLRGVPAWDWLHFEIQTAILVHREDTQKLRERIARLFAAPEFCTYAERAGIVGLEQALLAAYLLHCVNVQLQTEGLDSIKALLNSIQRLPATSR